MMTNESTKKFHSVEQLRAELFPNKTESPDKAHSNQKPAEEAEILANKLIEDLMRPLKKKA
jgi:hypothetical protein